MGRSFLSPCEHMRRNVPRLNHKSKGKVFASSSSFPLQSKHFSSPSSAPLLTQFPLRSLSAVVQYDGNTFKSWNMLIDFPHEQTLTICGEFPIVNRVCSCYHNLKSIFATAQEFSSNSLKKAFLQFYMTPEIESEERKVKTSSKF